MSIDDLLFSFVLVLCAMFLVSYVKKLNRDDKIRRLIIERDETEQELRRMQKAYYKQVYSAHYNNTPKPKPNGIEQIYKKALKKNAQRDS